VVVYAAQLRAQLEVLAPGNGGSSGGRAVVAEAAKAAAAVAAAAGAGHGRRGIGGQWARRSVQCVGSDGHSGETVMT